MQEFKASCSHGAQMFMQYCIFYGNLIFELTLLIDPQF